MELVTYCLPKQPSNARLGLALDSEWIVDLARGAELVGLPSTYFVSAVAFLQGGIEALETYKLLGKWLDMHTSKGVFHTDCLVRSCAVRWLPPVPDPPKIIATGRNFLAHLAESNAARRARGEAEIPVPRNPTGFIKVRSSLIGHGESIVYPRYTNELDYEGEVGAVIGRLAFDVSPEAALDHVAGYVVVNDISARDIQREEARAGLVNMGKNFPGFCPMGPKLVSADSVHDPQDLRIRTWVNGELRQDGNTSEMHFTWPVLISYWSRIGLQPGDIILSGTPGGVALERGPQWYLKRGDVVAVEVESLGRLENVIV